MRNFQEQVKKAFCYQKMFWPFTEGQEFAKKILTVGQNNFGYKIPILELICSHFSIGNYLGTTFRCVYRGYKFPQESIQFHAFNITITCNKYKQKRLWIFVLVHNHFYYFLQYVHNVSYFILEDYTKKFLYNSLLLWL